MKIPQKPSYSRMKHDTTSRESIGSMISEKTPTEKGNIMKLDASNKGKKYKRKEYASPEISLTNIDSCLINQDHIKASKPQMLSLLLRSSKNSKANGLKNILE